MSEAVLTVSNIEWKPTKKGTQYMCVSLSDGKKYNVLDSAIQQTFKQAKEGNLSVNVTLEANGQYTNVSKVSFAASTSVTVPTVASPAPQPDKVNVVDWEAVRAQKQADILESILLKEDREDKRAAFIEIGQMIRAKIIGMEKPEDLKARVWYKTWLYDATGIKIDPPALVQEAVKMGAKETK